MTPYDTEEITVEGRRFEVELYPDTDSGPPWENDCGTGIIRQVYTHGRPTKEPGEIVIHSDRGDHWLYNWAKTMKKAVEQGWGLSAGEELKLANKLGRKPTKGEIRQESVRRDMNRMRGWLRDDWMYIGVSVRIIGPDGEPVGEPYEHALWGVESDGGYWKEVAADLAKEILHERQTAWRKALHEARERLYWASRDIVTV